MNKMTFNIKTLCFLFFAVCVAYADAPGLVNYQGRLRESGVPAAGSKSMVFRLYDDPTGGAVVWTSDSVNVDVDRGVFSYKLGSHDPDSSGRYINNLAWSNSSVTYWLELTVDGKTLLPRERFTTVPFAFQATNSDTIDGYHAATFASTTTAHALAFSTGTIQAQVNALGVSTGSLQSQLNSVAISTASLQNQLDSVAGSTSSVQGQVNALAISTGSIQNRVNDLAYSTGTLSANFANYQLNLSTPSWQAYDSARLGSQLPSFYSQLNATQTITAQKTFLNQMIVSSNAVIAGSAGIGTAAPADKLHINDGNVRIQGGTPILYLQNTDSPAGTASILNWQKNLIFKNGDGDERLQIREDNNVVINPSDGNVGVGTAGPSGWFQVGAGTFTVLSNGNVGIGTTSPGAKLEIKGQGTGEARMRVSADSGYGDIVSYPSSEGAAHLRGNIGVVGHDSNISLIANGTTNYIRFFTGGYQSDKERVVISSTGYVGIGTTNPGQKLEVAGNAEVTGYLLVNGTSTAGAGIIEQGSNANGRYYKFANGMMMQMGSVSGITSTSFNSGFYYNTLNVTFPIQFTRIDSVTTGIRYPNALGAVSEGVNAVSRTTSGTSFGIWGNGIGTTATVDWVAWGTWQ